MFYFLQCADFFNYHKLLGSDVFIRLNTVEIFRFDVTRYISGPFENFRVMPWKISVPFPAKNYILLSERPHANTLKEVLLQKKCSIFNLYMRTY